MKKTTIITEAPRRRRFSDELKASIIAEMAQPGTTIAELARRYEISQALLYNWRRDAAKQSSFVRIVPSAALLLNSQRKGVCPWLAFARLQESSLSSRPQFQSMILPTSRLGLENGHESDIFLL